MHLKLGLSTSADVIEALNLAKRVSPSEQPPAAPPYQDTSSCEFEMALAPGSSPAELLEALSTLECIKVVNAHLTIR